MPDQNHARVLFGAASPLIVDYEETLARLSLSLHAVIVLGGKNRALSRDRCVALETSGPSHRQAAFLPCAFTPARRRELTAAALAEGFTMAEALIDPSAVLARSTRIGKGTYINSLVTIGGASILGTGVVVNRGASIGHHSILGDFSSVAPGAIVAGNVRVGENSVIGIGAVIYPDVRIGSGAVVAGGAVVKHDVADGAVVQGHPAKPVRLHATRTKMWITTQE